MFSNVALILLCGSVIGSLAVNVNKCKGGAFDREGSFGRASIHSVQVTDCAKVPCKLRKGSEVTISFDFTPDRKYNRLTTSVFGGLGLIRVPFNEVHGKDACSHIIRKKDGAQGCPLEPKEVYSYTNSLPILKAYPAVSVNVQYGLNDGNSPVTCFTLPAKISN